MLRDLDNDVWSDCAENTAASALMRENSLHHKYLMNSLVTILTIGQLAQPSPAVQPAGYLYIAPAVGACRSDLPMTWATVVDDVEATTTDAEEITQEDLCPVFDYDDDGQIGVTFVTSLQDGDSNTWDEATTGWIQEETYDKDPDWDVDPDPEEASPSPRSGRGSGSHTTRTTTATATPRVQTWCTTTERWVDDAPVRSGHDLDARWVDNVPAQGGASKDPLPQPTRTAASTPTPKTETTATSSICMVSDLQVKRVMEAKPLPLKGERVYNREDITYGVQGDDYRTADELRQVRALVAEFDDIWATEAMPSPCNAPPMHLNLRKTYQSRTRWPNTKPNWRHYERMYLQLLAKQWLSFGIIEEGDETNPVLALCRVMLADKEKGANLRTCYDGRPMNPFIQPKQTTFTNIPEMVERAAADHYYKSCFDFQSAYFQCTVDKESRQYLGITLPDEHGNPKAYRFAQMPFGLAASAAHMVNLTQECVNDLPPEQRLRTAYYVDDLMLTSPTFAEHLLDLRRFFAMCRARGMTLHPKKSHIFCGSGATFLGFKVGRGSHSMSESNVQGIVDMPRPKNRSDARHVMGVFATARRYIHHFTEIADPLRRIMSPKSPFAWGDTQQRAFDELKEKVRAQTMAYKFDPKLPIVIYCDASQYAGGCWLTQDDNGTARTIAYYSTTLSPQQQRMGAFAREAYILLYSLDKCRPYMDSSPHVTTVYTDAHSLQYVQASTRTALSSRLLAKVADLRFKVLHIPGKLNTVADALSRFKMASPSEMLGAEHEEALNLLLKALPRTMRTTDKVWVQYSPRQDYAYKTIQLWREKRNQMVAKRITPESIASSATSTDLAIVHTPVMEQVNAARLLFERDQPFCLLMCIDLVSRIFVEDDGSVNQSLLHKVRQATKRMYMCHNHVWLLHRVPNVPDDITLVAADGPTRGPVVAPADAPLNAPVNPIHRPVLADIGPGEWDTEEAVLPMQYGDTTTAIHHILKHLDMATWSDHVNLENYTIEQRRHLSQDVNGQRLFYYTTGASPRRIVVPVGWRNQVMDLIHISTHHASARVVAREISTLFYWPTIRTDTEARLSTCGRCQTMKKRINHLHGLYKGRQYSLPRLHYGLDVKRLDLQGGEVRNLLLAVDAFTGYAIVMVMPTRSTASLIRALEEHILTRFGTPATFTADEAKEFVSVKFKDWCRENTIQFRHPLGYYPQQNGTTENWWIKLEQGFRNLHDFAAWEEELRRFTFAQNCRAHDTTGCSPFELFHGGPANTALANLIAKDSNVSAALQPARYRQIMRRAAVARETMAAANANTTRRQRAAQLNQRSKAPPAQYNVGDAVQYYVEPRKGTDNRPRFAVPRWKTGTVTAVNDVAITVKDARSGLKAHRHRTRVKPAGDNHNRELQTTAPARPTEPPPAAVPDTDHDASGAPAHAAPAVPDPAQPPTVAPHTTLGHGSVLIPVVQVPPTTRAPPAQVDNTSTVNREPPHGPARQGNNADTTAPAVAPAAQAQPTSSAKRHQRGRQGARTTTAPANVQQRKRIVRIRVASPPRYKPATTTADSAPAQRRKRRKRKGAPSVEPRRGLRDRKRTARAKAYSDNNK